MRLWSLHPSYLDGKGLVALWRESLLALNILKGNTKGYLHHPQLERFKQQADPVDAIQAYLFYIFEESVKRGYCFDQSKLSPARGRYAIPVTIGQLAYEKDHLLQKLQVRNPDRHDTLRALTNIQAHPIFTVVEGPVQTWEKI